jgi:phosphoribosylformimino-5-aminoimidazole carboxamide ribonucleotide (ProFAR) isomerase
VIIPCIDLMDGKVVQLVQRTRQSARRRTPAEMLERFKAFPEIQVIDLDAAIAAARTTRWWNSWPPAPAAGSEAASARRSAPAN